MDTTCLTIGVKEEQLPSSSARSTRLIRTLAMLATLVTIWPLMGFIVWSIHMGWLAVESLVVTSIVLSVSRGLSWLVIHVSRSLRLNWWPIVIIRVIRLCSVWSAILGIFFSLEFASLVRLRIAWLTRLLTPVRVALLGLGFSRLDR